LAGYSTTCEETGELDNTLIIYTTDNGPEGRHRASGELPASPVFLEFLRSAYSQEFDDIGQGNTFGFIGSDWAGAANGSLQWWKWFIGEGGIRVPMIVVPPKNPAFNPLAGEMTNEYAYVKELPMTILDYAGVEHPGPSSRVASSHRRPAFPCDRSSRARSVSPRTEDEWVVFELFGNTYVQAGDYKAIRMRTGMYGDGEWHLYDIKKDPGETNPLEDEQPERLQEDDRIFEATPKEKGLVPVADDWSPWAQL
jgi:arylsulfatase A-like enzyme